MKQKLALCCALVHRPELLLLDEPTTGVDAVSRREFWDLLETLQADGLTIIASTPYMDEAARCDRIALIQGGRILAIDPPAAVGHRFPRPLFAVRGLPRATLLTALRKAPHVASAFPFGETVHVSDERTALEPVQLQEELAAYLAAHDVSDVSVTPVEPGIEDAFMELMGVPAAVGA
jgi:ABC-type multidrug transport system ATPase subunit